MFDGGPFGTWSGDIGTAASIGWLLGLGLAGSVLLVAATSVAVRRAWLAGLANGLLWLVGATAVTMLVAVQGDDGRFCTTTSLVVAAACLATLLGAAVWSTLLLRRRTSQPPPPASPSQGNRHPRRPATTRPTVGRNPATPPA